jgi:hypothetical protein
MWGKVFKKKEEIISREIAGETILVPISGKLADMQKIFAVDAVAEFIWQQVDGKNDLSAISDRVVKNFDVDKKQAGEDILEFVDQLLNAQLIEEV